MTSPYLERPLRPRHEVIADILSNVRETYLIVDMTRRGEPYIREADLGQSFGKIVRDLADGQYDFRDPNSGIWHSPVAVLRMSRDEPMENVTEKVAEAVFRRLAAEGALRDPQPFLDNAWPDWERHAVRDAAE